jgi:hypothetical protein
VDIYWTRLVRFASQLEPEACVVAIKTALTVEPTMTGKIISKGRQKKHDVSFMFVIFQVEALAY